MSDTLLYPDSGAGGNRMQSAADYFAARLSKFVGTCGEIGDLKLCRRAIRM